MASGFNFYSSFQISRIIILDIPNNYSGYPELEHLLTQLWISRIIILDIRNKRLILDIQNNYCGYPK